MVDEKIRNAVEQTGVRKAHCVGREQLERLLTEDKKLRGLVPRVYGLGDLSELIDERIYAQTQALLSTEDLAKFVPTKAYFASIQALAGHGFALLIGEPASGKSSIMTTAAIHAADRWQADPLWLSSPAELRLHWNPNRPAQLFMIDDVFGSTNFDPERAEQWNQVIPLMRAAISKGTRFLLTSRDYIFAAARRHIKRDELPVSKEGEVVIDVEGMSVSERRQIVYNHLRLGNQPRDFKTAAKPHLARLTQSRSFLPETARRLGDSRFTKGLDPQDIANLGKFFFEPRAHLLTVITTLPYHLQASLVILMCEGGMIPMPNRAATYQFGRSCATRH